MSYIQLISDNNNSAYYSTNFSDIITIKPNSKIALIDVQVNRDTRLDFSADVNADRTYSFGIDWGAVDSDPDKSQGGMRTSYTFDPKNLPKPYNDVTFVDFVKELENVITSGAFQNYNLTFSISKEHTGNFVKIQSVYAYKNLGDDSMEWNNVDTDGWINNDDPEEAITDAMELISTGGTLNPDGDYSHNYIMTKDYIAVGGNFAVSIQEGLSQVIGLSWKNPGDDPTNFTNDYFSTSATNSEFWLLDGTVWLDRVTGLYYKINDVAPIDFDEYLLVELAGGTTFATLENSNISAGGCTCKLTNASNPGGVNGNLYAGDMGIGKCTLSDGGSGYSAGIYDVETYDNGQGAKIEVLTVDGVGKILTFRIHDEGRGYTLNTSFRLIGGDNNSEFLVVDIITFILKWDGLLPSDITLYFQPDHVSNTKFPRFVPGLPDIPIGVHISTNDYIDDINYIVFKHGDDEDYNPYDRFNIEILDTGKLDDDSCIVSFKIGLNQTFDVDIFSQNNIYTSSNTYKLPQTTLPPLAQLYGVVLSDCSRNRFNVMEYDRPRLPQVETFKWVGNDSNRYNEKQFIEIDIDFTGGLDRILGIDETTVVQSGRYKVDFIVGDNPISTQGEGKRYNICIDNLNMKSYKNFSNDYTTTTGFISGVADRMIGSMPTFINGFNYGILYFQPNPIYIDLNNPTEKRINQLTVSFRDVETNKVATDLYGSSIVTIHITN